MFVTFDSEPDPLCIGFKVPLTEVFRVWLWSWAFTAK